MKGFKITVVYRLVFITVRNQRSDENFERYAPPAQREDKMATTMMQNNENMEMTDNDAEIAENNGAAYKHDSLMEYSNIQLDFIKVFGKKVFVMVIGKFLIQTISDKFRTFGMTEILAQRL